MLQSIDVKGQTVAYWQKDAGNNGSLIFIHGAGGTHERWKHQMEDTFFGFVATALDLPGHGASGGRPYSTVKEYAQGVLDFAAVLRLPEPWIITGHSLGGAIALQIGLERHPAVGGLILVATGAKLKVNPAFLAGLEKGVVSEDFFRENKRVSPELLFYDFTACNNFNIMDRVKEISYPSLVIVGDEDQSTPPRYSHFLKDNLPQAELVEIPGAGHRVMLEAPDNVNQAIKSYLGTYFTTSTT